MPVGEYTLEGEGHYGKLYIPSAEEYVNQTLARKWQIQLEYFVRKTEFLAHFFCSVFVFVFVL